jgi:hypothetical protein
VPTFHRADERRAADQNQDLQVNAERAQGRAPVCYRTIDEPSAQDYTTHHWKALSN